MRRHSCTYIHARTHTHTHTHTHLLTMCVCIIKSDKSNMHNNEDGISLKRASEF